VHRTLRCARQGLLCAAAHDTPAYTQRPTALLHGDLEGPATLTPVDSRWLLVRVRWRCDVTVWQDLLAMPPAVSAPGWDSGAGASGVPPEDNLPVREDPSSGFYVAGLQVCLEPAVSLPPPPPLASPRAARWAAPCATRLEGDTSGVFHFALPPKVFTAVCFALRSHTHTYARTHAHTYVRSLNSVVKAWAVPVPVPLSLTHFRSLSLSLSLSLVCRSTGCGISKRRASC
jgi:hypothetical protein